MIQRWAVKIEYDGKDYNGWQKQNNGISIQQRLEEAASLLSGGFQIPSITAGRTDTGVHALGQVAHLDFPAELSLSAKKIRDGINYYLQPDAISILEAVQVDLSWNARFSAIRRRYLYKILNRPSPPAIEAGRVWHVKKILDVDKMHAAAQTLLGKHDFTSYRATTCQASSPLRTLDRLDVIKQHDHILFEVEARSFLHHQVRNMVGTLKMIGEDHWPVEKASLILKGKDRRLAGPTAPAAGLYLKAVDYKLDIFDPEILGISDIN
ncbi:MAG: tRNA pseudouridine(38-40) synthase TruA [Commensalibacter sp.]